MTEFPLPLGFGGRTLRIPDRSVGAVLRPPSSKESTGALDLRRVVLAGAAAEEAAHRIAEAERLLVLVNDATRPTPTGAMLSALDRHLSAERTTILIATGAHRCPDAREVSEILAGCPASWRARVRCHDAQDLAQITLGKTQRGTPVLINALVEEADLLLALSSVEPHYFAGLTGGWKSIVPGIAGYATIEANHRLALDLRSAPLVLEGNPVHEDLREAAQRVGPDRCLGFQVVLDERHAVVAGAVAPLGTAFAAMAEQARQRARVRLERPADVVVSIATPPLDRDFYQAHKALENARGACRKGGILLLIAACVEGLGPDVFLDSVRRFRSGELQAMLSSGSYRLSDHKLLRLQAGETTVHQWLATGLAQPDTEGLPLRCFSDPQEAVDAALEFAGPDAEVVVIPDGGLIVPSVGSEGGG